MPHTYTEVQQHPVYCGLTELGTCRLSFGAVDGKSSPSADMPGVSGTKGTTDITGAFSVPVSRAFASGACFTDGGVLHREGLSGSPLRGREKWNATPDADSLDVSDDRAGGSYSFVAVFSCPGPSATLTESLSATPRDGGWKLSGPRLSPEWSLAWAESWCTSTTAASDLFVSLFLFPSVLPASPSVTSTARMDWLSEEFCLRRPPVCFSVELARIPWPRPYTLGFTCLWISTGLSAVGSVSGDSVTSIPWLGTCNDSWLCEGVKWSANEDWNSSAGGKLPSSWTTQTGQSVQRTNETHDSRTYQA